MRILQVTNGYPPAAHGGVETYTQAISENLTRRGHVVEVLCRVSSPREPEYRVRLDTVNGIPIRRVVNDLTGATRFEAHYRSARFDGLFRQHLRDFQPEVVHFQHCIGLSAAMLREAYAQALPVIVTLHDFWFFCPRATLFLAEQAICPGPQAGVDCVRCLGGVRLGPLSVIQRMPLYKWLLHRLPRRARAGVGVLLENRPTAKPHGELGVRHDHRKQMEERTAFLLNQLRQASLLLTPSDFVRSAYGAQGLERERIEVLPLGVDVTRPAQAADDRETVFAYMGTLQYHKGPGVLIEAFRMVPHLSAQLRLYGRGDPLDTYSETLQTAARGDSRIRFMGAFQREALAAILAAIDLLVVPSLFYETYSLAAREALLAGVPVIASKLGALPEVIRDGENGYLVPAGDAAALAQALSAAAARLPELQTGARATPAAPTVAEHVTRLEECYERATVGLKPKT